MGLYKNEGDAAAALAEECSEVIQIISKYYRFGGTWDDTPIGKSQTRWEQLEEEMYDLLFQWERLKNEQGLK